MNKPPVTVRVQGPTWEAVIEVPGIYGDSAGVAARLRAQGIAVQRRKSKTPGQYDVIVNANHIPEGLA